MHNALPLPASHLDDLLNALNPAQRAAVEAVDGPVLVLAGAGTGKTRVLTTRLAYILLTGRANPFQIMSVTFTNKAAREMQERVAHIMGQPTEGWFLGTFHSLATRILRKHAERIGLKSNFTILDMDDQHRLIKQILEAENIDIKRQPPRLVAGIISRWKDKGYRPEQVPAAEVSDGGRLLRIYHIYQERLQTLNACDFGDLLLHNITLLQNHQDLLQEYQHRFRYILVDEYQDTNVAQYLWLRLLMLSADGSPRNICCVGDEDQSIYGWRGAEIGNILRFEQDFPGAETIRLEENYRSTGHILGAAASLIAHNRDRLGKTLWTASEKGDRIRIVALWDGESEARFIGDEVENAQRRKLPLNKMAVLVRAGFQTREFEERLLQIGVPYRVIGGPRFYERQEIRDAIAYFRLLQVPEDDLAFERIINTPKRGLGPATIQQINIRAREQRIGMLEAARQLTVEGVFKAKNRATFESFLRHYDLWREAARDLPHTDVAERILEESGYIAMWQAEKSPDAGGRLDNLKELINAMSEFDTMQSFLEHISLVMEANESEEQDKISLMTLHAAKGLEFDLVFLPGWEEEIFPSRRTLEENGMKGLEEERRLAYVGITRARKNAVISHVTSRYVHGSVTNPIPSRFIAELPEEHVDNTAENGMFTGRPRGHSSFSGSAVTLEARPAFSGPGHYPPRPKPVLFDSSARDVTPETRHSFKTGQRVFHAKFGYGNVTAKEGNKLEIEFDLSGPKKVMADFIVPEEEAGKE
jgi:DNA helicase-2/ATP-dependent DNA helicase PcrA